MQIKSLPIVAINARAGTQTRAEIQDGVVDDYAEIYQTDPETLPPLIVYSNGGGNLLADGFHRYYAARKAGLESVKCEVRLGDFPDALACSLLANVRHGVRRSNEDKRRGAEIAIAEWPDMSDRKLAEMCRVDHKFIAAVRAVVAAKNRPPERKSSDTSSGDSPTMQSTTQSSKPNAQQEQPTNTSVSTQAQSQPTSPSTTNQQPQNGKNGQSQPKAPRPNDETGTPIPDEALTYWKRKDEIQALMTRVSDLKSEIKAAKDADDPLFATMSNSVLDELGLLYFQLHDIKPYAVCSLCMGTPSYQPDGCHLCRGSGMISKKKWDTVTRKEVKDLRAKANAMRK